MEMAISNSYDNECCHIIFETRVNTIKDKGNCLLLGSSGWEPPSQNEPLLSHHSFPRDLHVRNNPKSRPYRESQQIHFPVVSLMRVSSSTHLSTRKPAPTHRGRIIFLQAASHFLFHIHPIMTQVMNAVAYPKEAYSFWQESAHAITFPHLACWTHSRDALVDTSWLRPGQAPGWGYFFRACSFISFLISSGIWAPAARPGPLRLPERPDLVVVGAGVVVPAVGAVILVVGMPVAGGTVP